MGLQVMRQEVRVDLLAAVAIARSLHPMLDGKQKVLAELALLLCYCDVADGTRAFSKATHLQRAMLVVRRGSSALCRIIDEVAAMSDDDVMLKSAEPH